MTQYAHAEHKNSAGSCHETGVQDVIPIIDDIIGRYRGTRGALIPVLQSAQNLLGYLPKEVLIHISDQLDIPYSEVAGVVTFYSFFTTVPRGKHTVRVCLGTACYVRGGKEVLDAISKELRIEVGQTTEDRLFSLEIGRCFGACGLAPVVMIDETVFQRVKPSRIRALLDPYRIGPDQEADHETN
jgi:NADH:ubiquinone oxidoreductase subunit E